MAAKTSLVIDQAKLSRIRAKLRAMAANFPTETGRALYVETEIETTECKRRTPVDLGNLRASEFTLGPVVEGTTIYTMIVAGGPSAPYALYVHEDLDAFHRVGQAKFIESVVFESAPYMAERVARRIDLARMIGGES